MKNEDDLLVITPVANYKAPKLPTYRDGTPISLQKIPRRWQNKTLVEPLLSSIFLKKLSTK